MFFEISFLVRETIAVFNGFGLKDLFDYASFFEGMILVIATFFPYREVDLAKI